MPGGRTTDAIVRARGPPSFLAAGSARAAGFLPPKMPRELIASRVLQPLGEAGPSDRSHCHTVGVGPSATTSGLSRVTPRTSKPRSAQSRRP